MACYIPKWYTGQKTVTHPGTNRARRALTSFMLAWNGRDELREKAVYSVRVNRVQRGLVLRRMKTDAAATDRAAKSAIYACVVSVCRRRAHACISRELMRNGLSLFLHRLHPDIIRVICMLLRQNQPYLHDLVRTGSGSSVQFMCCELTQWSVMVVAEMVNRNTSNSCVRSASCAVWKFCVFDATKTAS